MREALAIFSSQFAPHVGGVETFTRSLAAELEAEGVHAVVVTTGREGLPAREELDDGTEVVRLPALQLLDGRLPVNVAGPALDAIMARLSRERVAGVLVNTRLYGQSLVGCHFARSRGLTPVVLDHGSSFVGFGVPAVDWAVRLYERGITELVKRYRPDFYGISAASAAWLATFGIEAKGVISNAIDAPGFRAQSSRRDFRHELGLGEGTLLACFAGRVVRDKGIPELVEVARLLGERDADVTLAVAGDGPDAGLLSGGAGRLVALGRLGRPDVAALLAASDVHVLLSRTEGLPTAVLEAGAVGTPSLATDVGGVREVVPDDRYGIVVEHADPAVCAEVLACYARDPRLARAQGALVRRRVEERFSWRQTAHAVLRACRMA